MTSADRFTGHDLSCIRAERLIFTGIDFDIAGGGALKLTGPNGSGKSSLLRLMAGLLRAESGTLAWNGADPPTSPTRSARRCAISAIRTRSSRR